MNNNLEDARELYAVASKQARVPGVRVDLVEEAQSALRRLAQGQAQQIDAGTTVPLKPEETSIEINNI